MSDWRPRREGNLLAGAGASRHNEPETVGKSTAHRKTGSRATECSGWLQRERLLNFPRVARDELNVGGTRNTVYLLRTTDSDDPASNSGIPQGPRDGHLAGRRVVALPNGAQRFP